MRKFLIIAALLLASPALAQQLTPGEYTIKLTPADVGVVGKALGAQPFNDVAPLLQKLQRQIEEQNKLEMEAAKKSNGAGGGGGLDPRAVGGGGGGGKGR